MNTISLFKHSFISAVCCISLKVFAGGFTLVPGAPLTGAIPLEVKGRNGILIRQKLSFGNYHTACVKRGWIKSWSGETGFPGLVWVTDRGARQSIRFALTDGVDTAQAIATTRVRRHELNIGSNRNNLPAVLSSLLTMGTDLQSNNLFVALRLPGEAENCVLFLDNEAAQLHRDEPAGYLRRGNEYYTIHPVWMIRRRERVAAMPFGAVGIEFRDQAGRAVAAANLMNGGAVQLLEGLSKEEGLLLSAACTAVLLQSAI